VDKAVRVDDETYRRLSEYAGELQARLKRPVSISDAVRYLARGMLGNDRVSDLAGTWDVSDEEIVEIRESLEKGWQKLSYC